MAEEGLLPKIQKRVSDFTAEERGQITKQSLISVGGILAAGAALSALASSAAAQAPINLGEQGGCSRHDNNFGAGHVDNVRLPGAIQAQHGDSPAYTAHCNHGNHSSY